MALWFDTTGVWGWDMPQHTGIQRVVTSVIRPLLETGADLRLFRYAPSSQRLVPVALHEMDAVLASETPRPSALSHDTAPTKPAGHRPGKRGFLAIAARQGPPSLRAAIENARLAQETLKYELDSWMRSGSDRRAGKTDEGGPPAYRAEAGEGGTLFQPGDVCVSMCLTENCPGFWQGLSIERPKGVQYLQLLHDIGPVAEPQWTPPHWSASFDAWLRGVTAHSDRLLTVSRFQQAEILRYLRSTAQPEIPVDVVSLGCGGPALMKALDAPPSPRVAALLARPFVLCVSGFYPRKNHAALYNVWRRLSATLGGDCPQLVLVGEPPRTHLPAVAQMERDPLTKDRISIFYDLGDDELGPLYSAALYTVYPSLYEGWGLPVSESLGFGRYCLTSSAASLPEVGGDLVDYFDPLDQMDFYNKALRAIRDRDYVRAREEVIRRDHVPISWSVTADQLLASVDRARGQA